MFRSDINTSYHIVWNWISSLESYSPKYNARIINELDLKLIILISLSELLSDKSKYQKQLQQNISLVIKISATIFTDDIYKKLIWFQHELVKRATINNPMMILQTRFLYSDKNAAYINGYGTVLRTTAIYHRIAEFNQRTVFRTYRIWWSNCKELA